MPKKRRRKKKQKVQTVSKTQAAVKGTRLRRTKKREHAKLGQRLYDNEAAGLFRLVSYMPLFIGAWLVSGIVLQDVLPFVLATIPLGFAHYFDSLDDREDIPFAETLKLFMGVGAGMSVLALLGLTDHIYLAAYSGLAAAIIVLEHKIPADGPLRILLLAFSVVIRSTVLGIVGILTQIYASEPKLILVHGVIGFVPGMVLAASLISRHAGVLQKAGWSRTRQRSNRKGESVEAPGRLTQAFALFLLIGPAVPVMLTPLGFFPLPFLLCALSFLVLPQLAQAFFKSSMPDNEITVSVINLAAALAAAVLAAAVLARFGF